MPPQDKWKVFFVNGDVQKVFAYTEEEAKILAQATQIRKGCLYQVEKIEKMEK